MRTCYLFIMLLFCSFAATAQTTLLDFEGAAPTFNDFNGSTTTIIDNPDSQDPNTTPKVAQNVVPAGVEFAGVNIPLPINLGDGKTFTMQVWSPIADAPVLLKIENSQDDGVERAVNFSGAANSWQTLEFDFSSEGDLSFAGITIFMNFNMVGGEELTFYWDNLVQSGDGGGGGGGEGTPSTLLDFEAGAPTFNDFNGSFTSVILNPDMQDPNTSDSVAQNIVPAGAEFAGVNIPLPVNLGEGKTFTMQVWSPIADAPVLLKIENSQDDAVERAVNFSGAANSWQTLEFDFSSEADLSFAGVTIFMNFNMVGGEELTFYWDNLVQILDGDGGGGMGDGAQMDLPVTFDDPDVDYGLDDFEGNSSMFALNPDDATDTVASSLKMMGSAPFAGTTLNSTSGGPLGFASRINFTATETVITVNVWVPNAGTPVRLKVENANDPTISVETQTNTTVGGAWETLEFDFANEAPGTAALNLSSFYNKLSIFFNFGTDGEGNTYLWDDVIFTGEGGTGGEVATLPLDFEDGAPTFNDFNGSFTSVVLNPDMQEPNVSDSVALNVVPAGAEFAGVNIPLPVDLSEGKMFTMQVWSPVADAPVLLKIENSQDDAVERAVNFSGAANSWQTLEFDFSSEGDLSFASVTVFMNFNVVSGEELTFYWDNLVQMEGGGGGGGDLEQYELPITFEGDEIDYGLAFFGGANGQLVTDPEDMNNTVGQLNKGPGGEIWAGVAHTSVTGGPSGLATPIPFAVNETAMTVRVWSPTAGTPIRLKAENFNDAQNLFVETEVLTTVAGGWETMTFDFANNVDGTPALDLNTVYNQIVIFFNFGTAPAAEETYYWDDILFVGDPNSTNTPLTGVLEVFPNPTQNRINITAPVRMDDLELYGTNGQRVGSWQVNAERFDLDLSHLAPGLYIALVNTVNGPLTVKVLKD